VTAGPQAVQVSDPQNRVRHPSLMYEFFLLAANVGSGADILIRLTTGIWPVGACRRLFLGVLLIFQFSEMAPLRVPTI